MGDGAQQETVGGARLIYQTVPGDSQKSWGRTWWKPEILGEQVVVKVTEPGLYS